MTLDEFNELFPHLAATTTRAKLLARSIGRHVKYRGRRPSDGRIHRTGVFEIIGVQLDHAGVLCYRVRCIRWANGPCDWDDFGRVMPLDRVRFVK